MRICVRLVVVVVVVAIGVIKSEGLKRNGDQIKHLIIYDGNNASISMLCLSRSRSLYICLEWRYCLLYSAVLCVPACVCVLPHSDDKPIIYYTTLYALAAVL